MGYVKIKQILEQEKIFINTVCVSSLCMIIKSVCGKFNPRLSTEFVSKVTAHVLFGCFVDFGQ